MSTIFSYPAGSKFISFIWMIKNKILKKTNFPAKIASGKALFQPNYCYFSIKLRLTWLQKKRKKLFKIVDYVEIGYFGNFGENFFFFKILFSFIHMKDINL